MVRSALLACSLAVAPALLAQEPIPPELKGGEKLAAILERVGEAQSNTTSLQASFEQRKVSHLLAEPSVLKGQFYFRAPDQVLWRYEEPRPMTVLVSGGVVITYRPQEKRAERVEVGRVQRRVFRFLGVAEPLDELRERFDFTLRDPGPDGDYTLILQPTGYQLKKRLTTLEVTIDRSRFLPVAVSYGEPDGDSTSYSFHDIVRNQPIEEGLFTLELPADVEVVELKLRSRT